MSISESTKKELLSLAQSQDLYIDMKIMSSRKSIDNSPGMSAADRYLIFLNDFNEFINHERKPFKPFKEKKIIL